MSSDEKRDALREKIEAAEQRHEERNLQLAAKEAAGNATEFVKKHPLATVGGAVVIGLAIGAMTKSGRRLSKRGGAAMALAADTLIRYGMEAIDAASDAARDGQDRLEDLGDSVQEKARSAKLGASHIVGNASNRTRSVTRRTTRKAGRLVRDARKHISP